MARLTKTAQAEKYAQALVSTCERYFAGYMVYETWTEHMRHLWMTIEAKGLRNQVLRLVVPGFTATFRKYGRP